MTRVRLYSWDALVRRILNDRAIQTNCSETCYIYYQKAGTFLFSKMLNLFSLECRVKIYKRMNWYLPATNTWNKSIEIPEIWLDFTILQRVANKLFRNESYIIRKYNIVAFQNCFSYFQATNCFSNKRWRGALKYACYSLVRHISPVSLNDRAVQTNYFETCCISSKSWECHLFRNF